MVAECRFLNKDKLLALEFSSKQFHGRVTRIMFVKGEFYHKRQVLCYFRCVSPLNSQTHPQKKIQGRHKPSRFSSIKKNVFLYFFTFKLCRARRDDIVSKIA